MKAQRIVVGYDGSANARKALDAAIDHIGEGGTIHVVTAQREGSELELARIMAQLPEEFHGAFDTTATPRGYLRDAEMMLDRRGVAHVGHFVDDRPASAILDIADEVDADLIVVGSRGLGPVGRFVHGSVSSRVANHATTSIMIVRADET